MSRASASFAGRARSQSKTNEYRARDPHVNIAPYGHSASASWDEAARVVRFSLAGGALEAAITRDALEMLAGAHLPTAQDAMCEFRRHRAWIEMLATLTMEECCELAVVLTQDDVSFQLTCEAKMLIDAVRHDRN